MGWYICGAGKSSLSLQSRQSIRCYQFLKSSQFPGYQRTIRSKSQIHTYSCGYIRVALKSVKAYSRKDKKNPSTCLQQHLATQTLPIGVGMYLSDTYLMAQFRSLSHWIRLHIFHFDAIPLNLICIELLKTEIVRLYRNPDVDMNP